MLGALAVVRVYLLPLLVIILLLLALRRRHLGGVSLAPLGPAVLEPNLRGTKCFRMISYCDVLRKENLT